MKTIFTTLIGLAFAFSLSAQSLQPATISTNSTVEVLEQDGDITYLGGSFSQIGFKTNYHSLIPVGSNVPDFDLLQPNSNIDAAVPDGSGGWYIGGSFTQINGENVTRLAHILPDLTLDPNFAISLNSTVTALFIDGSDLYVGGSFTQASGIDVFRLIRVNAATGSLDNSWLPQVLNGSVRDIVPNGDNVYIGGNFSNIEGEDDQRNFAIFSGITGESIPSYSFNTTIEELYLEGDDKLFAAGSFTQLSIFQSYLASYNPAESNFPNFDFPDANSTAEVIIPDGEGGWYIGGSFSQIDGENASRLIHILSDGTVDPDFTPTFNSTVNSIFIDGNDLYVGGSFSQINGFDILRVARLDKSDGTLDESWGPNPNSTVEAIAVDGNNVYIGGSFTQIAGTDNAIYFAVIDGTTGEYIPSNSVNSTVLDIKLNGSDIYLGGSFTQSGFRNRYLSMVSSSDDTPDFSFPDANGAILVSIPDGDGGWYIGGNFTQIEGESASRIAHILSDYSLDPNFTCNPNSSIHDIFMDGEDLYISGSFTVIDGVSITRAARINRETGVLDESWAPSINSTVWTIHTDENNVYLGGSFTSINGNGLIRYFAVLEKSTGNLIQVPSTNNAVYDFEENGDDLLAAGAFTATGFFQNYLASFPDESVIPEFNSVFTNSSVYSIIPDGSGGYYSAGAFSQVNGAAQQRIVHILADGTVDENFTLTTNSTVLDLALDGTDLYFSGTFTNVNGSSISRLAKVEASTGILDTDFNPSINSTVNSLSIDGGVIYFGGSFTIIDGETRERLAAVDSDGNLIVDFAPSLNSTVEVVEVIGGEIYFGGSFSLVNGITTQRIAAVDDTGILTSFDAGTVNSTVYTLEVDGSNLYIGGAFSQIEGSTRNRLASLNLTTGALQSFDFSVDNGAVFDLEIQGTTMAVGGSFTQVDGQNRARLCEVDLNSEELGSRDFSMNANVRALLRLGSNLIVGGDFTYINTRSDSRIFEIDTETLSLTDFSIDNINGTVNDIDLVGSTLYLGGTFGQVNGENRLRVAALNLGDLSLTPLNPEPNSTINDLEVVGDMLYMAGLFTQIGGENRGYVGAYDMNAMELTDWNPGPNTTVNDISILGDDILLGGNYTFLDYRATAYLAELDPSSNKISALVSGGVNSTVYEMFVENDNLYAGGSFTSFGGESRLYFAQYNLDTETVEPLTLNCNNRVEAVFKDGDNLYIGGLFNSVNDVPKGAAACYDLGTEVLSDWNPRLNSWCYAIGALDGNVILGGPFSQTDQQSRSRIACVNLIDGTPDSFEVPNINGTVFAMERYGDDLIFSGSFNSVNSESRPGLAAANIISAELSDLALTENNNWIEDLTIVGDELFLAGRFTSLNNIERGRGGSINLLTGELTDFNPLFSSNSIVLDSDGTNLFFGGAFTFTGLQLRNRFAAINTATNEILPLGQGLGLNNTVFAIEFDEDNIYVGGAFGSAYGENRLRFASISKADNTLNPLNISFNNTVDELKVNNGILYCGGSFTDVGGNARTRLASIDLSNGTVSAFAPNLNNSVTDIEFNDGNIYFSGSFTEVEGESRGRLAALDMSDNSLLDFNPASNAFIRDFDFSDGLLYVAGDFSSIGGESRDRLASLSPVDGSATAWNPDMNGSVYSIDLIENYLFAGGSFTIIGGEAASRLTLLDKNTGEILFDFTPEMNSTVRAVRYFNEQLLMGGQYTVIGANYAHPYFGQFNIPAPGTSTFNVELTSLTDVNGFDIGCNGDNTGEVEISLSGGTAPYSYTLTNENQAVTRTGDIASSSETSTESDLPAGNYTITVTDGNDGVANGSILLTEPSGQFEADLSINTLIQTAGGSEGAIEIDLDGGNPPFTYSYTQDGGDPVSGDIPNNTENAIIDGLSAGSFVFNFEDANGCATSEGIDLDDYVPASVSFTIWDEIICNGDDNGRIRIQAFDGNPPYNYMLDGPGDEFDTNGILNFNGSATIVNNLGPGVYSIIISDQTGAESTADDVELVEPDVLSVSIALGSPVSSPGNNDGSLDVTVSGGVSGYSYSVNQNGSFFTSGFSPNAEFAINNLPEGEYFLLVTDQNSCQVTSNSILIEEGVDPCAGLGGDSDGDGLCDDVDPCPLLPNLQNGDDCGINGTVEGCVCVESCNLTLGTPIVQCSANTTGDDDYTVTIFYSGSAPGAVLSVTDISGCDNENITISGDNPSTDPNGSIVLTINESESCWGVSISSDLCNFELNGLSPSCENNIEGDAFTCSDGIDNDGDGFIDCEDGDCQGLAPSNGCITCFGDGLSFADEVIEYSNTCTSINTDDPTQALGTPDIGVNGEGYVSLGNGFVSLAFTNNTLVNSGNEDPDLFVFEIGPAVEGSFIELRPLDQATEDILIAEGIQDADGDGFYDFGSIGGATASVDIDAFFTDLPGNSVLFDAIKITDDGNSCSGATPGADIDGVCALSSLPCSIGATCDDGDPNTENDVFDSSCNCVGEPIFECPDLMANNGDSCQGDGTVVDCECLFPDCNGDLGGSVVDTDNDGICDDVDNCLNTANPGQADLDDDGFGDLCDDDIDGDGVQNDNDCDPFDPDLSAETVWYFDGDGDGFGTDQVLSACEQPDGYAPQPGDCDDSNPDLNPGAQFFSFVGDGNFTSSTVFPEAGSPSTEYTFAVVYTDATGALPAFGFPRVLLDFEGNGSLNNPNDRTILLTEEDASDNNTADGKTYVGSIIALPAGTNYELSVQNISGSCVTSFGPFDAPDVLNEPDLEIFADNITFDNINPDVSSPLEITALITNASDLPAENFTVDIINQFDPDIDYPEILVPYLGPNLTTEVTWTITTPDEPAWCPIQVIVDTENVIIESNEDDNIAVRPFVNGDFEVPGDIIVDANVSPAVQFADGNVFVNVFGFGEYIDTAIPLDDPSVAGGTVTLTNPLTGATYLGNTNSNGYFSVGVQLGNLQPGTYTLNGELTDFTLTGEFSITFQVIEQVIECLPDLVSNVSFSPVQIFPGETISGTISVSNVGCATSGITTFTNVTQTGGLPLIPAFDVPPLEPGESVVIDFENIQFDQVGTYTICSYADANFEVEENSEGNNNFCKSVQVVPPLPDISTYGGNTTTLFQCFSPAIPPISVSNIGYVPTGAFDYEIQVFFEGNLETTLTGDIENLNPGQATSVPVGFVMENLGVYTYTASFDLPLPNGEVVEISEANNFGSYSRNIVVCKPDLRITSCGNLEVEPADLEVPGDVTYLAKVLNAGNATASGPVPFEFTITNGESYAGSYPNDIAPGETVEISVSAAAVESGTEELTATVDPDDLIEEFNESNNSQTDILCWDFAVVPKCGNNFWNATYAPNQTVTLSVGLRNDVLYKATNLPVKFEVSGPGIPGTADLGNAIVDFVDQTCSCPYSAVLPTSFLFTEVGTYTFTMTADPDNEYSECSEDNNVLVRTVEVTTFPDFRILSEFINPSLLNPEVGESVFFDISYENIGVSNIDDEVDLTILINEEPFQTIENVPGLLQGENTTISIAMPYSSNIAGANIVRAIIDSGDEVQENNELNNEATRAIIVGSAANLFFEVFLPDDFSPNIGQLVNIDATIGNNGDIDVDADVLISFINNNGDDVQIGAVPISVEAGGSVDISLPWNVTDNNTTLLGEIANASEVEFDYTDNFASAEIGSFDLAFESVPFCEGSNLGSITVSPTGGEEPYSFNWSNGSLEQTIEAAPGTYSVTVTDANGAEANGSSSIGIDPSCVVPECSLSAVSFTVPDVCNPETGLYAVSLTLAYANAPEDGTIDIDGQSFEITGSPQIFNFEIAEGPVLFNASFSADESCSLLVMTGITLTPCEQDCEGTFGGSATVDECGVCDDNPDNDNQTCIDCEGVPNGDALPGTPCIEGGSEGVYGDDCSCIITSECSLTILSADITDACDPNTGLYGVIVELAYANAPDNGNLLVNGTNYEITGSPQTINLSIASGPVVIDAAFTDNLSCSATLDTGISLETCEEDCAGVFGGSSTLDECGVCDDNPDNDNETCIDCEGVPNGSALPGTPCMLEDGGTGTYNDECGCDPIVGCSLTILSADSPDNCDPETGLYNVIVELAYVAQPQTGTLIVNGLDFEITGSPQTVSIPFTEGAVVIQATFSEESSCTDLFDSDVVLEPCAEDCAGVFGGNATEDECGVCDDNPDNDNETCADCSGVPNGDAFFDECGECVGGDTGLEPCDPCAASAGSIEFSDGTLNQEVCVDDEIPSMVMVGFTESPFDGLASTWVVTDDQLNLLSLPQTADDVAAIDFDDAPPGNCLIWFLNFDPENSNVLELVDEFNAGATVNADDLMGCFNLSNSLEVERENCDVPGVDCEDWVVYQADIRQGEGGVTDIYEVTFDGSDANLALLATSDVEIHIAYNEVDNLIYAITAADGSYRTLNPHMEDAEFSEYTMINGDVGSIHSAAFNLDGKLIIGSSNADEIYCVSLDDNNVDLYDGFAPVSGGDIAFGQDGTPFLATRAGGGGLYIIIDDEVDPDFLIGSVPNLVTGMALGSTNQLLVSHRSASTLMVRNLDGSVADAFNLKLDGEMFTTFNGDMASGCNTFDDNIGNDCNYALYYTHVGSGAPDGLYSLSLGEDGIATAGFLTSEGDRHIALSPDGTLIYMVGGSNIQTYEVSSNSIINDVSVFNGANDANLSGFPAAVADANGNVFIAGAGSNVWQVNPETGEATNIASGISVSGGDLIVAPTGAEDADELWIITRNNNTFRKVLDPGVSFSVDVPEINGAAVLENGNVLVANGDGDGLGGYLEISLADGSVVDSYDVDLPVFNGDLAGGCTNSDPLDICDGENGDCYATAAEYVQGLTSGGGALSPSRTDANQSLGMPEGTDDLVFTTLGYGGSLTFQFGGLVPNGTGDDIQVVETSFNNPGCEAYPEYADVSVSVDGDMFYYIGTVCKGDPFVDIADAVDADGSPMDLGCVFYVRVATNEELTSTPDGYDVDGIVALHNCEDDDAIEGGDEDAIVVADVSDNVLSSYPNPTAGMSQAVFVTGTTTRTTLEVYDMNGRTVATLFNQIANEGQEYRIEFDGARLPNGVYVYRLTTENETIIEKFMIAK